MISWSKAMHVGRALEKYKNSGKTAKEEFMEQIMEYVPNMYATFWAIGTAAGGNYSGTGDKRGLQFPFIGIVIADYFTETFFSRDSV